MKRDFGGVIWTDHALERLKQRGITQSDAYYTFRRPDQSRRGRSKNGSVIYYKTYKVPLKSFPGSEGQKIEVVATKNRDDQWVIMSVWAKPVFPNKSYKKSRKKKQADSIFTLFIKRIFGK